MGGLQAERSNPVAGTRSPAEGAPSLAFSDLKLETWNLELENCRGGRNMSHVDSLTIVDRLERVERSARRWRLAAAVAGALLGATVLAGAGGKIADGVRARSLALVDAEGRDRAVLAMSAEGSPTLVLYDGEGKRRLALGVSLKDYGGVPEVWLTDKDGEIIWKKRR